MNPRLLAIAGPLKGRIFALAGTKVHLGRNLDNDICINDPLVSSQHCLIEKEPDGFKIRDLDSLNHTFVNDDQSPVKQILLAHGDTIRIGDSRFFTLFDEDIQTFASNNPDKESMTGHLTTTLRLEDGLYGRPEKMLAGIRPSSRVTRDLNAFLKISTAINSIRKLDELQRRLLELIGEVIPAERGAILMTGMDPVIWIKPPKPNRPLQTSETLIRQAVKECKAILINDSLEIAAYDILPHSDSYQIRSLIVVPLPILTKTPMEFDGVLGAVYLDTSDPEVCFDKNHLELMTAIAGTAVVTLKNVWQMEKMQAEIDLDHNMVGKSPGIRNLYQVIAKVAPKSIPVLIRGESGTGKELVAETIHQNSLRKDKPFVAINCAAIPESLLESELFGYEKGAFSGATTTKIGLIELANGGTVFLDEIGDLALMLQPKLLRVIEGKTLRRLGGLKEITVDVRLIAATNRNLEQAIKDGLFREDLFYRLNVIPLEVPPLRERMEDIALLANYFAAKYSEEHNRQEKGISADAWMRLMSYNWPGNVRELKNVIERAVVLSSTGYILPGDLPQTTLGAEELADAPIMTLKELVKRRVVEIKKQHILRALELANGDYDKTAAMLGLHRNNLHREVRKLNIQTEVKKQFK